MISGRLKSISYLPSEFARHPRHLKHIKRYKATEFRTFLLYSGVCVLQGLVKPEIYEHFLCLSVATRLLLTVPDDSDLVDYAHNLLVYHTIHARVILGPSFTTYNIHNLIHVADDVKLHGCSLHELSAFPFENYLQKIKKMVRNNTNPLAQIVKRLDEMDNLPLKPQKDNRKVAADDRNGWFFSCDKFYRVLEVHDD